MIVDIQIHMEVKSLIFPCKTNLNLGLYNIVQGQIGF